MNPGNTLTHTPAGASCRRGCFGFTLIELLTVIAIVGILAAILIPTVGAVRESAKRSQCVSNQRQILAALHLHAAENRGLLPVAAQPGGSSMRWVRDPAFTVYLPVVQRGGSGNGKWEHPVFICPSVVNTSGKSGDDLRVTYAASAALYGPDDDGALGKGKGKERARRLDTIQSPARTVMLFDGKLILQAAGSDGNTHTNYSYHWHEVSPDATVPLEQTYRMNFIHKGAMNVGMVDGSVRPMKQDEFARLDDLAWRGLR